MNPENRKIFPRIPFRKLEARFTRPQISEGFDEIIDVNFQVSNAYGCLLALVGLVNAFNPHC